VCLDCNEFRTGNAWKWGETEYPTGIGAKFPRNLPFGVEMGRLQTIRRRGCNARAKIAHAADACR
jgi:hypothetical protein